MKKMSACVLLPQTGKVVESAGKLVSFKILFIFLLDDYPTSHPRAQGDVGSSYVLLYKNDFGERLWPKVTRGAFTADASSWCTYNTLALALCGLSQQYGILVLHVEWRMDDIWFLTQILIIKAWFQIYWIWPF